MNRKPSLIHIPFGLHSDAIEALEAGDAVGFLCKAGNEYGLDLVLANCEILAEKGIYESALIHAFVNTRTNNAKWTQRELVQLFTVSSRERFLSAGDPLPGPGPFTLYRGVAGGGAQRRERGLSWTSDLDLAWWFAYRGADWGLPNPGVVTATVAAKYVIAHVHTAGRRESEFIVLLPKNVKLGHRPTAEGRECANRYQQRKQEELAHLIESLSKKGNAE